MAGFGCANHLTPNVLIISYKKWVQREKYQITTCLPRLFFRYYLVEFALSSTVLFMLFSLPSPTWGDWVE